MSVVRLSVEQDALHNANDGQMESLIKETVLSHLEDCLWMNEQALGHLRDQKLQILQTISGLKGDQDPVRRSLLESSRSKSSCFKDNRSGVLAESFRSKSSRNLQTSCAITKADDEKDEKVLSTTPPGSDDGDHDESHSLSTPIEENVHSPVLTRVSFLSRSSSTLSVEEVAPRVSQVMIAGGTRSRDWLRAMIMSQHFDLFCGVIILVNSALIGMETEHMTHSDLPDPRIMSVQFMLNLWYILELAMRLFAQGCRFFWGPDWRWNFFDACLVATSVLDLVAEIGELGSARVGRMLRVIRLVRITRTMRLVRIVRYLSPVRKMIQAMVSSSQTLFWCIVLLFFVMYIIGIWLCQGVANFKADIRHGIETLDTDDALRDFEILDHWYGSLMSSIGTLFLSITNGISWHEAAYPLTTVNPTFLVCFVIYITVSAFGLLNVVTSIFVESAMESAQHSRELMVQERAKSKALYGKHIREIFTQIDTDRSGLISKEELVEFLEDDTLELRSYFDALGVDASDSLKLFQLLDSDSSGEVNFQKFHDGCTMLKGDARSFDIHYIIFQNRMISAGQDRFQMEVESALGYLNDKNSKLEEMIVRGMTLSALPAGELPVPVLDEETFSQI